jgi:hypothetical protein
LERQWDSPEAFVDELRRSLEEESSAIRETELDWSGGYLEAVIHTAEEEAFCVREVFVDTQKRVVLPASFLTTAYYFTFIRGDVRHTAKVLRREPRYSGTIIVAWVFYLDTEGFDESVFKSH